MLTRARRSHRFIFLVLICFLSFGSYFVYDNPAALQSQFEQVKSHRLVFLAFNAVQDLNLSTARFMLMYAVYSWPNVALCFFGGFLMDRVFGVRCVPRWCDWSDY